MPGSFVGTPDFASPEQFAGVQVDIRGRRWKQQVALRSERIAINFGDDYREVLLLLA